MSNETRPSPASGEILDVQGAAKHLKMSTSWVYRMSAAGVLPCVKLGRRTRFYREQLDAWVRQQTAGGGAH